MTLVAIFTLAVYDSTMKPLCYRVERLIYG